MLEVLQEFKNLKHLSVHGAQIGGMITFLPSCGHRLEQLYINEVYNDRTRIIDTCPPQIGHLVAKFCINLTKCNVEGDDFDTLKRQQLS